MMNFDTSLLRITSTVGIYYGIRQLVANLLASDVHVIILMCEKTL